MLESIRGGDLLIAVVAFFPRLCELAAHAVLGSMNCRHELSKVVAQDRDRPGFNEVLSIIVGRHLHKAAQTRGD